MHGIIGIVYVSVLPQQVLDLSGLAPRVPTTLDGNWFRAHGVPSTWGVSNYGFPKPLNHIRSKVWDTPLCHMSNSELYLAANCGLKEVGGR